VTGTNAVSAKSDTASITGPASSESSDSSSGGSSGATSAGGTGALGASTVSEAQQTRYFPTIQAGGTMSVDFSEPTLDVVSISITAAKLMAGGKVVVKSLKDKPSDIPIPEQSLVYRYLDISESRLPAASMSSAEITFKLESKWLAANNIKDSDVVLKHFDKGQWVDLPTELVTPGIDQSSYKATTPHFSLFAISAKKIVTPEPAAAQVATTETSDITESTNTNTPKEQRVRSVWEIILPLIIGLVIIIPLLTFMIRWKGPKHPKK